jgi:hypothetical protein
MTALLDQYLDHVHQQTAFKCGKMEAGKVRNTLLRVQGFSGEIMPRHTYAEKRVAAGNVEIDWKRKHYKNTADDTLYLFSDVTLALVDYTNWLLSRKEDVWRG